MNGPLVRALARIARPTPAQEWLAQTRPITPELKAAWAHEDRCLEVIDNFWRDRCVAVLGEAA